MKLNSAFKIGLGLLIIAGIGLVSFKSFANKNINSSVTISNNVVVTINKTTTNAEFEDIKSMLKEHGITAVFSEIQRNDLAELTGLKIKLEDGKNASALSKISSNTAISEITFGRKNGSLFISQGKTNNNALSFFNRQNMPLFGFDNDSLFDKNFNSFGGFNLNDFFDAEGDSMLFGGSSFNMDKMREHMQQFMQQEPFFKTPFSLLDDTSKNKLIIIDGKESDFITLEKLQQENKLADLDDLKPKIAMSLYGNKAKHGAIIAISK